MQRLHESWREGGREEGWWGGGEVAGRWGGEVGRGGREERGVYTMNHELFA